MSWRWTVAALISAATFIPACAERQSSDEQSSDESSVAFADLLTTPVGEVNFPTSCNERADALVERGVALLHHMMYANADLVFGMAEEADPECALAYWGQSMRDLHPLWPDRPTDAMLERGEALVERAIEIGGDDREDAYIETARAYFKNGAERTEAERLASFEQAWRELHEAYPEDLEAKAFFALAHLATADPNDTSFSRQLVTGALAEEVLAASPNHPGAHHYIIHSYDYPGLAPRALEAANNYGVIAPRVAHATHMMTHIYTRLGMWDESIRWNLESADAGWDLCVRDGVVYADYLHALDYLAYAYLQKSDDESVVELMTATAELQPPYGEVSPDAAAYAFAALPARYALERRDWEAASELQPRTPADFPWRPSYARYVAITHFARALGNARLGRVDAAAAEIETMERLRSEIAASSDYWAKQVDIQIAAARAWLLLASRDEEAALETMRQAASLEATTEKHPVTPGEVLPASELLGDMLFAMERNDEALAAYERTLTRSPNRLNSLYGAGAAALRLGDETAARSYFERLLSHVGDAASSRPAVREARAFVQAR